jgi:hypothetical protein
VRYYPSPLTHFSPLVVWTFYVQGYSDNHVMPVASDWIPRLADIHQRELEGNKILGRQYEGSGIVIRTVHGTYFLGFSIRADLVYVLIFTNLK